MLIHNFAMFICFNAQIPLQTNMQPILLDIPPREVELCADTLKSVAHPIRMSIIDLLGLKGPLCVTDIYETLNIEQAVASHHLGILKSKGLLSAVRDGKHTHYKLEKLELLQVLLCIRQCSIG